MRFLPLLSSRQSPIPWISFGNVELAWEGGLHEGWPQAVRDGLGVHALHLPQQEWGEGLLGNALEALRAPLGADFLVIPAGILGNIPERATFLNALELLLEALQGRGVKIALRPLPGATPGLVSLLKEMGCDAVGYCWDQALGADLDLISDRLFCAVDDGSGDFTGLRRLGYRWNLAVPAPDPRVMARTLARLKASHPMIFFPEVNP